MKIPEQNLLPQIKYLGKHKCKKYFLKWHFQLVVLVYLLSFCLIHKQKGWCSLKSTFFLHYISCSDLHITKYVAIFTWKLIDLLTGVVSNPLFSWRVKTQMLKCLFVKWSMSFSFEQDNFPLWSSLNFSKNNPWKWLPYLMNTL